MRMRGTHRVGTFHPGNDQKLRTDLEHRVGGLAALRSLVEASQEFTLLDVIVCPPRNPKGVTATFPQRCCGAACESYISPEDLSAMPR